MATSFRPPLQRVTAGLRKVVVLEMGAGDNVRTVRMQSHSLVKHAQQAGAVAQLVRVNPVLSAAKALHWTGWRGPPPK